MVREVLGQPPDAKTRIHVPFRVADDVAAADRPRQPRNVKASRASPSTMRYQPKALKVFCCT